MTLTLDRLDLPILTITDEAPNVRTFTLLKPEHWTWEAGAHARFGVMNEDRLDQRTMSVSSLDSDHVVTMTTRRYATVSPYKAALWEKVVGETLSVSVPRSRLRLPRENRPVLLLAMGVGMAALLPLVRAYLQDPQGVVSMTMITVDREINLFESKRLEGLVHHHTLNRMRFYSTLNGVLNSLEPVVVAVGSERFVESVIRTLKARGVLPADVRLDKKSSALDRIWERV